MKINEKKIFKFMDWGFLLIFMPIVLIFIPTECFARKAPIFFCAMIVYMAIVHIVHRKFNPVSLSIEGRYFAALAVVAITTSLTLFAIYFQFTSLQGLHYTPEKMAEVISLKGRALWLYYFVDLSFIAMFALVAELLRQKNHSQAVERERNRAEITLYRSQIKPHFMLNTLNTLYGMHITGDENTSDIFLKFTGMVRYSFETGEVEKVLIGDEIEYIEEYIDIHRLRLGRATTVDFCTEIDDPTVEIPPMLLITFVENCFKYGVSSTEESNINISISLKERELIFKTTNRVFTKDSHSTGIGIENCRKRLELLYPTAYSLECRENNGVFTTNLTIKL